MNSTKIRDKEKNAKRIMGLRNCMVAFRGKGEVGKLEIADCKLWGRGWAIIFMWEGKCVYFGHES